MDTSGRLSFLNNGDAIISSKELPNPSYLCILEKSDNVNRPSVLQKNGGLCIVSELDQGIMQPFSVQFDGMKVHANTVGEKCDTSGAYPCHITSTMVGDGGMESIIVCNYGENEGVLSIFGSSKDADQYTRQTCISFGPGSNVDTGRQEASHAHSTSIITSPTSTTAVCCDLGSDAIISFAMNTTTNNKTGDMSLQCIEKNRLAAPPGSGPRSLMFNPVYTNIAIVSLEMTAEVWLIKQVGDRFEGLGNPVSLLPENWPEESANEKQYNNGKWASDAVFSPDGKYVYAAARLHNTIAVFEVVFAPSKSTSSESVVAIEGLKLIQRVPTGLTPRCLCMSECGEFILIANQHSHDISSFKRNENDGKIAFVNKLEVSNAACVKLVRPDRIG